MKILVLILSPFLLQAQASCILFNEDSFVYSIDIAGSSEYGVKTSPANLELDSIKFTIIGWIKTPASLTGQHNIMTTDSVTNRGWEIFLDGDEINYRTSNTTGSGDVTTDANLEVDTWYFVCVACAATTQREIDYLIYVDGSLKTTGTNGTVKITKQNTNHLVVGGGWNGDSGGFRFPFLGQLGELQIIREYNLSVGEITAAFTDGLKSSYGGGTVVAWYKWSGGDDATMLKDYSASGNNLTGNNLTKADDQVKIGKTYK